MRSISLDGDIANQKAKPKNNRLNTASATCCCSLGNKGSKPTSNATVAVRGIPNKGPIDKYSNKAKPKPNSGDTRPASACTSRSPEYAMATTPNSGNPAPVSTKPTTAGTLISPACCPIKAGKIRLPAPKNKANNIKPVAIKKTKPTRGCGNCINNSLFQIIPILQNNGSGAFITLKAT